MITLHFRGDLTTPRRDIAEDAEMVSRFSVDLWGKEKKKKNQVLAGVGFDSGYLVAQE